MFMRKMLRFFWLFPLAPKKAGIVQPLLIPSPVGDPQQRKVYVSFFDFIPLLGIPEKPGVM